MLGTQKGKEGFHPPSIGLHFYALVFPAPPGQQATVAQPCFPIPVFTTVMRFSIFVTPHCHKIAAELPLESEVISQPGLIPPFRVRPGSRPDLLCVQQIVPARKNLDARVLLLVNPLVHGEVKNHCLTCLNARVF